MSDIKHVHALHVNEQSHYKFSHPHRGRGKHTHRGQHTTSHRLLSSTKCGNWNLTSNLSSSGGGESSRGRGVPHRSTRATSKHIPTLDTTSEEEENLYFPVLIIGSIDVDNKETQVLTKLFLQSKQCRKLTCKLDTGAQGNALPI